MYHINDRRIHNIAPDQFVFWTPPEGRFVTTGPEQEEVPLPRVPLPIKKDYADDEPSDNAVGESVYDYLRRFPDCEHNLEFAELLRDAYPHYLSDLGAHAVMLDAKDVEPAYIHRKLTALKILRLLDRNNPGLLFQLCKGYYELALTFNELPNCHRLLVNAMGFGQDLVKLEPDNRIALNILAEIDMLYCDYPSAANKWLRLKEIVEDPDRIAEIDANLAKCQAREMPQRTLVEDLESVGKAMQLYAAGNYEMATFILERIEEDQVFVSEFPQAAEFFYLLGMCRIKQNDLSGAFESLSHALDIRPDHEGARQALEDLHN